MIEVAKVVYASKVTRLIEERAARQIQYEEKLSKVMPSIETPQRDIEISTSAGEKKTVLSGKKTLISVSDQSKIDESRRAIDLHNQRVMHEEYEKEQQRKVRALEIEKQNATVEDEKSKKGWGIVVAIIVIIVVVVLFFTKVR